MPEAIHFVHKHLKEPVPTVDNALVASCFSIMDALLKPYVRQVHWLLYLSTDARQA